MNYLKEKENISTQETNPLKGVTNRQEQEEQLIQMPTGISLYTFHSISSECLLEPFRLASSVGVET